MYYKNLLIGVAALMLATVSSPADCIDPSDPNCICTNCPAETNYPPSTVYTNGELHLLAILTPTNMFVLLKNGSLLEDYVLERSFDAVNWEDITPKFEVNTNGTADAAFPTTSQVALFRARVATYVAYATPGAASGSFACGSYIGYGNYYGFNGGYGYLKNTNMTRHVIYDGGGRTNTIMTYLGQFGENGCGVYSVAVVESSGRVRASCMFQDNIPDYPYPLRMKGLDEDPPDAFAPFHSFVFDDPGPNAQGFFY